MDSHDSMAGENKIMLAEMLCPGIRNDDKEGWHQEAANVASF